MKKLIFVPIVLSALLVVACIPKQNSNTGTTTTPATPVAVTLIADPAKNAAFVKDVQAVSDILGLGGSLALQLAVTGEERTQYATLLSGSGHVFEALETGVLPSASQVKNAYSAYFPTSADNYVNIANVVANVLSKANAVIANYVPDNVKNSDPAVYAAYVNYALAQLAKVAYQTADPFLNK